MTTRAFVFALLGLAVTPLAGAQVQNADPNQGPQIIHPAPSSPIGGVRSQQPSRITVGGVPDNGTPNRQVPIVPPPPNQINPGPVYPTPLPGNPGDHTRRDLLRGAYYANQPTYLNGWPYYYQPAIPVSDYYYHGSYIHPGWSGGRLGYPVIDPRTNQVHGYYNGNDWRLAFQLGGGFPVLDYGSGTNIYQYPMRMYRSYYAPWEDAYRYQQYGYYENPYLIVGGDGAYIADPRLAMPQPNQPQRELTPLEKGELSLSGGDADDAVQQFKLHLKDAPDDAGVERLLALALLDDRHVDQAVAVLAHAYTKQPQLARDPIDPRILPGGEMEHRRRFTAVMDYANRVKTASAYLAASTLAQSEGRTDIAKKLLEKAKAAGLDAKVVVEMTIALAK